MVKLSPSYLCHLPFQILLNLLSNFIRRRVPFLGHFLCGKQFVSRHGNYRHSFIYTRFFWLFIRQENKLWLGGELPPRGIVLPQRHISCMWSQHVVFVEPHVVDVEPTYSICRATCCKCSANILYMLEPHIVFVEPTLFFRGVSLIDITLIIMAFIQDPLSIISNK